MVEKDLAAIQKDRLSAPSAHFSMDQEEGIFRLHSRNPIFPNKLQQNTCFCCRSMTGIRWRRESPDLDGG